MDKRLLMITFRVSRRMKSNESKRSQATSKHETTLNTSELTQFFEHRISKKDQFRKNQPQKFNSFLQKHEIHYATPKICSNNIIPDKKNATVMLDYNNSNQSFGSKLNNTVVVNTSYRSGSRKRDSSKKTRVSWGKLLTIN